ncbi:MAG TPA: TonB-dependent receptor [Bacteroidales bacterium]|nr:TonB-dependent receptor [Bacteroidales bacterium]HQK71742.1 TonB-dependent receptor [Bacteroidales bacterium]
MKKTIILFLLLFPGLLATAQIRGKVTDGEKNEPFAGVTVQVAGTQRGTFTDAAGMFSITARTGEMLLFSFIGYKPVEYNVTDEREINIVLFPDEMVLDEVIVVGYGVQKRSDVTGSVASVSPETLESRPSANLLQSLQGSVAGLSISITGSNAEGSATTTRIRGNRSITASNAPLVILDGVPYSGNWAEINPNDIASMEILKDASSSAIYGARGANGVILIQTKKGKDGEKVQLSYDASVTSSTAINIPKMMDGPTFGAMKLDAGLVHSFTEAEMYAQNATTDWVDLALRNGFNQQHNLSLRGSGNKSRYFISGNYTMNKGIAKNDDFNRITLRINFDQTVNKYVTIGTSTQYGFYNRSGNAADFDDAFTMNPLGRAYTESGELRLSTWEDASYARNPLSSLNDINVNHKNVLVSNNYIDINLPVKGLTYKLNTGYTYQTQAEQNYQGRNTYEGLQNNGVLSISNNYQIDWLAENILSYNRLFGKHNIFLTGLYSAQGYKKESNGINATGFPSDVMTYYQPDKASFMNPRASQDKSNHISQMARANYSFDSRYLFTATVRRDGFSAFGADRKYGVFPSIALGWNINNEQFFKSSGAGKVVNNLKLRLSWGKNGNEAISPYSSLPNLRSLDYLSSDHTPLFGFYPSRLASALLGWETTTSNNLGLDFGILNDRINGSFDLYFTKTYDLLLSRSIPPINGASEILENIGQTKGSGIDLQISSINIDRGKFRWITNLSFIHNRSVLVDVGLYDENGNPIDDLASEWFIGHEVSVNYDYLFGGIWQEGESTEVDEAPGFIKYIDVNKDGDITPEEDKQIIGRRVPLFTAGLNNTFIYGNLSLSVFINGQVGETRPNYLWSPATLSYRENQLDKVFWTPENKLQTYPANKPDGSVNVRRMNFYEKTDFLRVQDITLAYSFNRDLIAKAGLSRLEAYASVRNLLTLTSWSGLDPEFVSRGSVQRAIPQTRQLTFGIRTSF